MNTPRANPSLTQLGIEDYLKTRINDQIAWYERKSSWNKNAYNRMQVASILFGSAIPILTVFEGDVATNQWIRFLIAFLGGGVAFISAVVSLYKYEENWVKYRTAAQLLTREKNLFLTQTTPYTTDTAFALFVQNCEAIMAAENSEWNQMFSAKSEAEAAA